MSEYILIIEDDSALASGLCRALTLKERTVENCSKIMEARRITEERLPDMIILDVNLPDGSGYDFLAEFREKSDTPVILLTANDMEADIVAGLELGADDYITKPFSLAVLRARVNAQLRKKQCRQHQAETYMGKYRFYFDKMKFFIGDRMVELSKTEQKLLRILTDNEGITVSRNELVDRIWTDGAEYVDENALSVTVKRLRDKLEAHKYIKTVYGVGYMWVKNHE